MRVQHQTLRKWTGIEHGFFGRNGGTSKDTYHSLNCGYGSEDIREKVRQNRALVAKTMRVEEDQLVTAHQVHSALALSINGPFTTNEAPKVDALVTNTPGVAVAILTADCGPILFADPHAGVVAAAHAGWRGAFDGVITATIDKMVELGAQKPDISAVLGPTISHKNYEVDVAFKDRFINRDNASAEFFTEGNRNGHLQFNLPAFIIAKLAENNIGAAINIDRCTYGEEDQFFSYRRSTHKNEPDYGRQISAIALI